MVLTLPVPGFAPENPLFIFNVDCGTLVRDEALAESMKTLGKKGYRFDELRDNSSNLFGYSPSNATTHPDFGVSIHLEFDDFGSYTEVKLIFPDGERDCLIRGPKDMFSVIVDLAEESIAEVDYLTCEGCSNCDHNCRCATEEPAIEIHIARTMTT